jgi:hypothetical protein
VRALIDSLRARIVARFTLSNSFRDAFPIVRESSRTALEYASTALCDASKRRAFAWHLELLIADGGR